MSGKAQPKAKPGRPLKEATELTPTLTTAVHLPRPTWDLLRAVAFSRAQKTGARASVSKVISDLVEERRAQFEKEVAAT